MSLLLITIATGELKHGVYCAPFLPVNSKLGTTVLLAPMVCFACMLENYFVVRIFIFVFFCWISFLFLYSFQLFLVGKIIYMSCFRFKNKKTTYSFRFSLHFVSLVLRSPYIFYCLICDVQDVQIDFWMIFFMMGLTPLLLLSSLCFLVWALELKITLCNPFDFQEKKLLLEKNGPHVARISIFEVCSKFIYLP